MTGQGHLVRASNYLFKLYLSVLLGDERQAAQSGRSYPVIPCYVTVNSVV